MNHDNQAWLRVDSNDAESIRKFVAGTAQELSSDFVSPLKSSTLPPERIKERREAAARWRHIALGNLYAGDVRAAAKSIENLLSYHNDLQSEPLNQAPFDVEKVTDECLKVTREQRVAQEQKKTTEEQKAEQPKYRNSFIDPFDPGRQANNGESEDDLFGELLARYSAALLTSHDLETAPIVPRAKILGDWLREGDLGFIYGPRGIGKTWLVDAIAVHISIGRDLDTWHAHKAFQVIYVDGEMAQDETRDRLKGLARGNNNLIVLHHERLFERFGLSMNLADPLIQKVITQLCINTKAKVLLLDNLSCLVSGVKENDSDAWEHLLSWLLELRRRRIVVVIVHHSGRAGWMRGTTKREDPANWIIKVDNASGDHTLDGAHFETTFEKLRNAQTTEWTRSWHFKTESDGEVSVGCQEINFEGKVLQLIQDGLETASDIMEELKCQKSKVSRTAHQLEQKKLIEISNRKYYPRGFMKKKASENP
jgi:hypothetical protein